MTFLDSHSPTVLFLQKDAMMKFHENCKQFGQTALIVTGRSSGMKSGALQACTDSLRVNDINYYIFDEITPNPLIQTVQKCAKEYNQANIHFVIAIGGGSVIDAAKAICFELKNLNCLVQQNEKPLPLVTIPTAAGTGSEINQYSILTIPSKQTKVGIPNKCYPVHTYFNPEFLQTLPNQQLHSMFFDIVCHAIESSLTIKASKQQLQYSLKALHELSLIKSLLSNDLSYETLQKFAMASVFAGIAIGYSGTSIPHGISYPITYFKGVSHGLACVMYLCDYLRICDQKMVLLLLKELGFDSVDDFDIFIKQYVKKAVLTEEEKVQFAQIVAESGKLQQHPNQVSIDEVAKWL